jgi:copper chaperone CopZ
MTQLSDAWTVRRSIQIPGLKNSNDVFMIKQALGDLSGIKNIASSTDNFQITISYEASQLNYQTIKDVLKTIGMPPLNNWWTRFKASWYQYTDGNAKDNANAPPATCCNKPPHNTY